MSEYRGEIYISQFQPQLAQTNTPFSNDLNKTLITKTNFLSISKWINHLNVADPENSYRVKKALRLLFEVDYVKSDPDYRHKRH